MGRHSTRYPAEVRERAVRLVLDHQGEHNSQWEAISSIAAKIGCTAETLRRWVRQAERDNGARPGTTTDDRERLKALERENRELRQTNAMARSRQSRRPGPSHRHRLQSQTNQNNSSSKDVTAPPHDQGTNRNQREPHHAASTTAVVTTLKYLSAHRSH